MVLNTLLRQSREKRGTSIILLLVAVAGEIFFFRLANSIFAVQVSSPAQRTAVVTGALTMLGGFVLVTSVTFALSSLYFARDLETLLTAPVRPRLVILSRIYTQLGLGIALGAAIAGPPLIAFLRSVGQLAELPLVAVTVFAFTVFPLTLATAGVIGALRIVPARYVRDSAGLVVTAVAFIVAGVNLFLRGADAFTSARLTQLPLAKMGSGMAAASWSPARWGSNSVTAALDGATGLALLWAIPLLAIAVIAPVLCARGLERAYVVGYQRNTEASRGRVSKRTGTRARRSSKAAPAWVLLTVKDLRQIRRDPSQLGQLALPLVLFALYLATPGRSTTGNTGLPSWLFVALSATFASLLFAANIALRGIGMEGQKFWIVRLTPTHLRNVLLAKYASGFVVSAIPAAILFTIGELNSHVAPLDAIVPLLRVLLLIATVTAIAVGLGAFRPRLDWTDPRRAVGIGTTLAYLGVASVYVTCAFIAFGLPYAFGGGQSVAVVLADVAVLIASAAIVAFMSWTAGLRLQRLEL
jgi:ABC-2 type transport system permease protein